MIVMYEYVVFCHVVNTFVMKPSMIVKLLVMYDSVVLNYRLSRLSPIFNNIPYYACCILNKHICVQASLQRVLVRHVSSAVNLSSSGARRMSITSDVNK